VLDGTERRRQRPTDAQRHTEPSSGKQKTHTAKNILLGDEMTPKVLYLGPTLAGKTHDKKAVDAAQVASPTNANLDKDPGFQGYEPPGTLILQPQKPRGREWGSDGHVMLAHRFLWYC
jgi:hypothetical protein